ncbi:alpha-ketoacid dehydrogenase subunit alpha/beta [Bryobacter aggregatus]|uniref:alpha-ketoacid dehydrogenase subunit alpha/beta n=1 Tax=Bryobacter aggregatus TaxID=360054 RepID=UPI00055A78EF|nr:thiamine pyrophosphate-dependent enzyme [Bryobacter aggregatus]
MQAYRSEPGLRPPLQTQTKVLTPDELLRAFRLMYLSRRIDDREILLKRQNKIYFQVSAAGHEAIQVAAGLACEPGFDWFHLYYRDRALALTLGITPEQMFLQGVGAAADSMSGGRQMPSHWSSPDLHIVSGSSPTGSQYLHAIGCAQASKLLKIEGEVTLVTSGEGATSEGEFWEAINLACLHRYPVIFLIEDNGYAISVPVEFQTPGGNISKLLSGFPGLLRLDVDGLDFEASYRTMREAVEHCREGLGPVLVHATVVRPYSHSLSDDERFYKSKEERSSEAERDPIERMYRYLLEEGLISETGLRAMMTECDREVTSAADLALQHPAPASDRVYEHLYSPDIDPTSHEFAVEPQFRGEPRTMVDTINQTLAEEMRRNPRVLVFGEDVADCSREELLEEVKGKGGVFKTTLGLQREFGSARVFNTPIAEAGIVGRAIGLSLRGLKPVGEIQFFDYIWPAMMQIRDELAIMRWRSNGAWSCPAVIRVPIGGYLTGGSIYHSQCGESIFTHIPGLRVVFPSNALDACGLLRTALRSDDPVLFLEHKKLYREPYNRSPHPGEEFTIPFGKANTVKEGKDLTILCYGALVKKALDATQLVEKQQPDKTIEVIDLRSLSPYDWAAIGESVRRNHRVLIAHEDVLSWGFGAEIAARIANELFEFLDAPVGRVAAKDTWVAYNPALEDVILPQVEDLVRECERLLAY